MMGEGAAHPGYARQKLVAQRASLTATLERQRLENMDLANRIADNETNMAATGKALAGIERELKTLNKEHDHG